MNTLARPITRCIVALGIGVAIALATSACSPDDADSSSSTIPSNSSTHEQNSGDSHSGTGETPAPKITIEPVIVVASVDTDGRNVSASGYVQGLVEEGKTCTFTFAGQGKAVHATHEGSANRMTTSCGLVQVPIDQFARGSWSVTLSYEADGKTFASAPSTVEIP